MAGPQVSWVMDADEARVLTALKKVAQEMNTVASSGGTAFKSMDQEFAKANRQLGYLNKEIRELKFQMSEAGGGTDAQRKRLEQMTAAAENLRSRLGAVGKETQSAMGQAAGFGKDFLISLTGIGSAVAGVMMVVNQLKAEYAHLVGQQKNAADAQITVAEARNEAMLNKPANMSAEWVDKTVGEISADRKVDEKRMYQATGSMFLKKGGLSDKAFAAALSETARLGSLSPGIDMAEIGNGIISIMNATKSDDPKKALGLIKQFQAVSGMTDFAKATRTVSKVTSEAATYGSSPREALQLSAYMLRQSGETQGRDPSAKAGEFMEMMGKDIIPGKGGKIFGGGATKFGPVAGGTFAERLTNFQKWYTSASEHDRKEAFNKMGGDPSSKAAMWALVERDPAAMATMSRVSEQIYETSDPRLTQNVEDIHADAAKGPMEPVRKTAQTYEENRHNAQLTDIKGGMAGAHRKGMGEYFAAVPGITELDKKWMMAKWELKSNFGRDDPEGQAIETIKDLQREKGYGAKYRGTARRDTWYGHKNEPIYLDELPAGITETPGFSGQWSVPAKTVGEDPSNGRAIGFRKNEDYSTNTDEGIKQLLRELIDQGKKPQPVTVVGNTAPAVPDPSAHNEGGR